MNEQKNHEMIFEKKHQSGAEEWICPTCGRRMLISWEPRFQRTILEAGNLNVTHGGFKNNVQIQDLTGASQTQAASHEYHENVDLKIDENRLTPWKSWLNESGFDDLWNREL